jgi:hypothetical protein
MPFRPQNHALSTSGKKKYLVALPYIEVCSKEFDWFLLRPISK